MITRFYKGPLKGELKQVQTQIVSCNVCPRLVEYRQRKALVEKRASFLDWDYWGAPVPSHGDQNAKLLIVGLAPAAHGANRTGRLFTGDPSADFLTKALHSAGFANQNSSSYQGDNLTLQNCFISSAIHCAPPSDRPFAQELKACEHFLSAEIRSLLMLEAILALGHIAFKQVLSALQSLSGLPFSKEKFIHGGEYDLKKHLPKLFACYHPSPRNTNTGRLNQSDIDTVFKRINYYLTLQDQKSSTR